MIVYREFESLKNDLEIPLKTLFSVSNNLSAHYKKVKIDKKDGTKRELKVPDYILKKIQRAISYKLLANEPVSKYAQAYRFGASVQRNASFHTNKKKVLKLDIKHFFDSILYSTVKEKCFPSERYSEPVRVLLSILCYHGDTLPQGAPSSPIITNIIMYEFDEMVGEFCQKRGIAYSRYCDDMTFSGDFDEKEVIKFVKDELLLRGYLLNNKKTVVANASVRQSVTGIVVNNGLSIPNEYKSQIRQELYFCKKHGIENHLRFTNDTRDIEKYVHSLVGRVSYVLQVEPKNKEFSEYKNYLAKHIRAI